MTTEFPSSDKPSESGSLQAMLDTLVISEASPEEFARRLFYINLEEAKTTDPELADILTICAIPRRLNVEVIGVLRDSIDDHATNQKLLARLLDYSFVLPRRDEGYVYHDNIRDALLEDWQADPDSRGMFNQLNQRLVTFYENQHIQAQEPAAGQLEQDLGGVARIIRQANPERYRQLTTIVQTRVVAPLLEALYHETLRSAEAAYTFFVRYYEAYEANNRLIVCGSLLNAARDNLERLPTGLGQEIWLKWLRLWEARLAQRLNENVKAENILNSLRSQTQDDSELRISVLGDLGTVLTVQFKLREALEAYKEELTLAHRTRPQYYNSSAPHFRIASLYFLLLDLDQAVNECHNAIQMAHQERNFSVQTQALLLMSDVLRERGDRAHAFNVALEALHLTRTRFPQQEYFHLSVNSQCMSLLATRAPQLLDTIWVESRATETDKGRSPFALKLCSEYVELLRAGGRLKQAEVVSSDLLADLGQGTSDVEDRTISTRILFSLGMLREDQGRWNDATNLYSQIIEEVQDRPEHVFDYAIALGSRGMGNAECARWSEAAKDLRSGIALLERIGHPKLVALYKSGLADVWHRRGKLAKAQRCLDEARNPLTRSRSGLLATSYHQVQGDVYRKEGKWAQARRQYMQVLSTSHSLDRFKSAAQVLGDLATIATAQGKWNATAQHTAEASTLWRQLAAMEEYQPSRAVKLADKDNAQGMYLFRTGGNERHHNIVQARDLFRSAIERVPNNFWYHLNLAYANAELKQWREAAQAIETVLEIKPEWLPSAPVLYARLADYHLRWLETLFATAKYEAAVQACAVSQARLEGLVPLDQMVEIWLILGDSLFLLGRLDEARAGYESGLTHITSAENPAMQRIFHARLDYIADARKGENMQKYERELGAQLLPEGWIPKESITFLAPDGQANVIASSEPLDLSMDTQRYAEVQGDKLRTEFPGYQELAFEPTQILGGHQGYIRHFNWEPPNAEPVTQIQLYYAEPGRGYTATATTTSTEFRRFELQLRQILSGLIVERK